MIDKVTNKTRICMGKSSEMYVYKWHDFKRIDFEISEKELQLRRKNVGDSD
jgi:hypothetical protein